MTAKRAEETVEVTAAAATPPFAHTWLTLGPSVAGRLVLPGRAPAAQGAPVLRPAIWESTGGKLGVPQRPRYRKFG